MPEQTASMEEYERLKKQLHQEILNERELEKQLAQLETDIFTKETSYLSDPTFYGNIIKGFDSFNKSSQTVSRRRNYLNDNDRIFSLSSSTYVRHLKKSESGDENEDEDDSTSATPRRK